MITHRLALIAGVAAALATLPAAASAAAVHGSYTTIDVPGAADTIGLGINDRGGVSGSYRDSHSNHFSFTGRPGHFTPVNDPDAPPFSTFVGGINNSGLITGAYLDTHSVFHGFLDQCGTFTTFNDPAGAQGTAAEALSNIGVIVGFYTDAHGSNHGFTFTPAS